MRFAVVAALALGHLDPRRDPAAARMLWRALLRGGAGAAASPATRLRLHWSAWRQRALPPAGATLRELARRGCGRARISDLLFRRVVRRIEAELLPSPSRDRPLCERRARAASSLCRMVRGRGGAAARAHLLPQLERARRQLVQSQFPPGNLNYVLQSA